MRYTHKLHDVKVNAYVVILTTCLRYTYKLHIVKDNNRPELIKGRIKMDINILIFSEFKETLDRFKYLYEKFKDSLDEHYLSAMVILERNESGENGLVIL